MKKAISLLLSAVMILLLASCAAKPAEEPNEPPAEETQTVAPEVSAEPAPDSEAPADEAAPADYSISYNNLGSGVWSLDFYCAEIQYFVEEVMGFEFQAPSANFTADQMKVDCQNLISSGIDGHVYYGAIDTLTPTISDIFAQAKIPFSLADQAPSETSSEVLLENPYFAGAVCVDSYGIAYRMGERAADMGYRSALIVAGAVGDLNMDGRVNGFTAGFTDNGGTIVGAARCTSPAEAPEKADDLFAAYGADADCAYAAQNDFANAAINAMAHYGIDIMTFAHDCDFTNLELIKSGALLSDGGAAVTTSLSAALLINYLDGKPIRDENDMAPLFCTIKTFVIDPDNADDFNSYWIEEHPLSDEMFEGLLYRYNPDVSYETWEDFIADYSYEYIMAGK